MVNLALGRFGYICRTVERFMGTARNGLGVSLPTGGVFLVRSDGSLYRHLARRLGAEPLNDPVAYLELYAPPSELSSSDVIWTRVVRASG